MKHLRKSIAFLLSLVLLLGICSPVAVKGAAVPTIQCTTQGMTIAKGASGDLVFTINSAYAQEKYYITIYDPSGVEVAYTDEDVAAETAVVELTIPVDSGSLNMAAGKYTVKFYLSYYSNSKWNNTDTMTAYFYVLENTCQDSHRYGTTETVIAPTCDRSGKGKQTCTVCSYVAFTKISAKHTYSDSADQTCNVCGWVKKDPTLIKQDGIWRYYVDGYFTEATTLVKYQYAWYYVKNGVLDSSYTGLVKFNGGWYYVRGGKVDFSATTLVKYNGSWWYVVNGKLSSSTIGLVKWNGEWWYVVNGKVASNTTTLVNHYGGWYYIYKGKLASKTTTLVKYNGIWYYVSNGKVDFGYNGTFYYCYKYYTVKNGRVV